MKNDSQSGVLVEGPMGGNPHRRSAAQQLVAFLALAAKYFER